VLPPTLPNLLLLPLITLVTGDGALQAYFLSGHYVLQYEQEYEEV